MRVWRRAEIYDGQMGGPLPWIVRVARNCAIDRLRARRLRAAVNAPAIDLAAVEAAAPSGIQTPEAAVLDAERRQKLTDALAGLPGGTAAAHRSGLFRGVYSQRAGATLRTAARDREDAHPRGHVSHAEKAGARRMIPDDIQALVLADAIGALDPDERRDLEARLAALPSSARAEVAHLYDASVEIAASASGEEPSPGVRDALLAQSCRAGQPHHHRHRWRMGRDRDARRAEEDPRDRPRTGSGHDAAQGRAGRPVSRPSALRAGGVLRDQRLADPRRPGPAGGRLPPRGGRQRSWRGVDRRRRGGATRRLGERLRRLVTQSFDIQILPQSTYRSSIRLSL